MVTGQTFRSASVWETPPVFPHQITEESVHFFSGTTFGALTVKLHLSHFQETLKVSRGFLFCLVSPLITALASKLGYSTVYLIPQCYLLAFFDAPSVKLDVGRNSLTFLWHYRGGRKLSSRTLRPATKIRHGSLDGRHLSTQRRATAPVRRPRLTTCAPCMCVCLCGCVSSTVTGFQTTFKKGKKGGGGI